MKELIDLFREIFRFIRRIFYSQEYLEVLCDVSESLMFGELRLQDEAPARGAATGAATGAAASAMIITPSSKKPGPAAEANGAGASSTAAVPSRTAGASAACGATSGARVVIAAGAAVGGSAITGFGGCFFSPANKRSTFIGTFRSEAWGGDHE